MRTSRITLLSAAVLLMASTAQAQTTCGSSTDDAKSAFPTCAATATVNVKVPYLATVQAAFTAPSPIVTVAEMNAGEKAFTGPTVTVQANFTHDVTATAVFSNSKPTTDLLLKVGTGSFSDLSNSVPVATGKTATSSTSYTTDMKILLGWEKDAPGSFSSTVTFTVTAP